MGLLGCVRFPSTASRAVPPTPLGPASARPSSAMIAQVQDVLPDKSEEEIARAVRVQFDPFAIYNASSVATRVELSFSFVANTCCSPCTCSWSRSATAWNEPSTPLCPRSSPTRRSLLPGPAPCQAVHPRRWLSCCEREWPAAGPRAQARLESKWAATTLAGRSSPPWKKQGWLLDRCTCQFNRASSKACGDGGAQVG